MKLPVQILSTFLVASQLLVGAQAFMVTTPMPRMIGSLRPRTTHWAEKLEGTSVTEASKPTSTDEVAKASEEEEKSETEKLFQKIKNSGTAGAISLAIWEGAFWFVSIPVAVLGFQQVTGHWPDFSNQEDMGKLGAEAFAFVNFARFAVPLRVGLALGTTPWVQENIVDVFLKDDKAEEDDVFLKDDKAEEESLEAVMDMSAEEQEPLEVTTDMPADEVKPLDEEPELVEAEPQKKRHGLGRLVPKFLRKKVN